MRKDAAYDIDGLADRLLDRRVEGFPYELWHVPMYWTSSLDQFE